MKTIENYALEWLSMNRPSGVVIEDYTVIQACVSATRQYASTKGLRANNYAITEDVTKDTEISISEWGIIGPLFVLYVDREVAISLEASRTFGAEQYGRQVSEIEADIREYHDSMKRANFMQPVVSLQPEIKKLADGTYSTTIDCFGFVVEKK